MLALLHLHPPGRLGPCPSLLALLPPSHPHPPPRAQSCRPPARCPSPPVSLRAPPSPAPGQHGFTRASEPNQTPPWPSSCSAPLSLKGLRWHLCPRGHHPAWLSALHPGLLGLPVSSAAHTPRLGRRPGCTARVTFACAGPSAGSLPHISSARSATSPRSSGAVARAQGGQ